MNIQTFIFNWRGQLEKTKYKIHQFKSIGIEPVIINSDDFHIEYGWHNIGESSYFTAQFIKALELFDGDVLMHVQADASFDNWKQLYEDAEKYFEQTRWGIYAPNVDYTWYDSSRTDIDNLQIDIPGVKIVANTDCTCWFIHKDIIDEFKNRNLDFSNYHMGWCWDIVLSGISFKMKRPVLRDYNHTIDHPKGTNYNSEQAEREMWQLYNSLPVDLQESFRLIKGDRRGLAKYYME